MTVLRLTENCSAMATSDCPSAAASTIRQRRQLRGRRELELHVQGYGETEALSSYLPDTIPGYKKQARIE
jgi:hypothetical protein